MVLGEVALLIVGRSIDAAFFDMAIDAVPFAIAASFLGLVTQKVHPRALLLSILAAFIGFMTSILLIGLLRAGDRARHAAEFIMWLPLLAIFVGLYSLAATLISFPVMESLLCFCRKLRNR
jgi:hypothetical protein